MLNFIGAIYNKFNNKITDSSTEQFTDSNGVDLISFFKETLNKNAKDRNTLLQIEEDLIDLVEEKP